ncbi:hypothetical protein ASZ90_020245 [hydrocarbon metagenome]|uniref:Uncharacterized protein n=1 Tax=hydrocarbon metagenome TaxID=938273 RepID=A0A0W8E181_9ZZZZ
MYNKWLEITSGSDGIIEVYGYMADYNLCFFSRIIIVDNV